jgi:tripartite ATP-independent transporter DctM subunit
MSIEAVLLILMFAGVIGGILIGVRILVVLMLVPLSFGLLGMALGVFDGALFYAIPERIFGIMRNQVLYAIPLFVLLGKLLEHSRLAERMLFSISGLSKNKGRSMALAVLATSVIIAAASGIIGATITMLAGIALPALLRAGVSEKISAGLVCAAGSLGQLIPPSIVLILLSDQISNAWILSQRNLGNFSPEPISVAHLFSAALLPGLMLAALYALYIFMVVKPDASQQQQNVTSEAKEFSWEALLVLAVILLVPLSIVFGFATAGEAASVGVLGVLILMSRRANLTVFKKALEETVTLTGVIFGIIIAASVLALIFRGLGGDEQVTSLLSAMPGEAMGALIVVMLVIFLLGFILEFIEITYIIIPVTAPVLFAMGVDPIWFAVLVAVNLQISFLTPPLGIALFYFQSVSRIKAAALYSAVLPFILLQILALLIVFLFPMIATWLPSILI